MTFLFLFANFAKIGLFAIGGGLATIPFFFQLAENHPEWLSREMIGNMLAIAQASPGAIGPNLSAYAGLLYAGIPGGYMAAFGLVAPAVVIIIIVARTLQAFRESVVVKNLFSGFRPAAAGLLSAAAFSVIALSLWNAAAPAWYAHIRWKEALIFAILFFLVVKFKKHPIVYVIAAGAAGVIFRL
ncbi:MAG: chromate transporter [Treponema sp.]|nr:chromate transporter [Treponema sp.]